jgi:hypothetical protein
MRGLLSVWIVCVSVVGTGVALAAPPPPPAAACYKRAVQLDRDGDYEHALATVDQCLAAAATDLPLLGLRGAILLEVRDYLGALAAYKAYIAAGVTGAKLRQAQKIVLSLEDVKTTAIDIVLSNGPAAIYLDSKSLGVFCTAAPSCNKASLPGEYTVIAERSGFERWTRRVTIGRGTTAKVPVVLVEKPSQLTIHATPPEAKVTVDDAAYDPAGKLAAGSHQVTVALAGHATVRRKIDAHEGKPVELAVSLSPVVGVRVEPPSATLVLDDKPIGIEDGGIVLAPGGHRLIARAPGFSDQRVDIPADRAADYSLVVTLERPKAVVATASPGWSTRRKVALAAGGVSVVALAGGIGFGLHSRNLANDALALCPSPSTPCANAAAANDLSQRGRSNAVIADVAYGAAGGAAIAAAVLWLTGAQESRVAVTPKVGPVVGMDVSIGF